MRFFGNLFRGASTVKSEMGMRIDGLKRNHEQMQSMPDEELFGILRKSKLYAEDSTHTMKAAMAEKVLKEKGYSGKEIKQRTAG